MTCSKNPEEIKKIFNEISEYYDKTNNFISFFTHYIIKYLAVRELNIKPHSMVLDICCGTGDFTKIIKKLSPKSHVIGADFAQNMLKHAKIKNPNGVFILADCLQLPFKDNEFNYVTSGFGLRNINNRSRAISEIYRILNHSGKFMHLDFGKHNFIGNIFDFIVPVITKILKINTEHYKYLLNSRQDFPEPEELIKEFENCGFKFIKRIDYLFGVISIQIMQK